MTRISARQALAGDLPGLRPPAEVVASSLSNAHRELVLAEVGAHSGALLQDQDLDGGLDELAAAAGALVRTRLRFACQVAQRGLHTVAGFGLADWLAARCPDLDAPVVRDLARLAGASGEAVYAPLLTGVLSGGMPLARAARIHRALVRVRKALSPEEFDQAVGLLASTGRDPRFDDADIGKVIDKLLRVCLPEKEHNERDKAQRELRDLHESSLADGSVRRIILTFGEDSDYEAVRAVITSPLAAPASAQEQEATGQADTRTPGQRRYDAFLTVLHRGVAATKGQPTTAKAAMVVTMDFQTLARQLHEALGGGRVDLKPGCGATLDGATLSAATLRRLACEADIIPMVLGSDSEILDQGRRRRLVTPGQRLRLAIRDGGCTIPGCSVPATWCDAHHIVHWLHGGLSDLDNYALLCPRHHAWVHEHNHTATTDRHGVTWHLR